MLRLRWPVAACLALAVVGSGAGVASFLSSQGASPYKAMLAVSDRLVTLRGEAQADYAQVRGDGLVSAGDALKTDERGTALLTYYDGSTVALSPLTDLVVERLDGVDLRTLYLNVGRVAITINKLLSEGSRYEVRTPSATIGVRGTRFVITVAPDGRTEVEVSEGRVELGAAGENLALGAGEGGVVERPGSRPQKRGVAASPSPPPPSPPPTPIVALPIAFQADKTAVSLDEPVRHCMTGTAPLTEVLRIGVTFPDGSNPPGWYWIDSDLVNRCRSFTFDSSRRYLSGPYTFHWRINGNPVDFTVTLTNGNSIASASPAPAGAVPPPAPVAPCTPGTPAVAFDRATFREGENATLLVSGVCPGTQILATTFLQANGRLQTFNTLYTWPNMENQYHLAPQVGRTWAVGPYTWTYVINGVTVKATITLVR